MIVGYARVSTDHQLLDSQLIALKAAGCEQIHTDTDISGSKKSRPALDTLLASLNAGDTLVIYKLDRIGRNTRNLLELVDLLKNKGVHLKSLTESIDTSSYMGQFFFTIIAALAEMERSRIIERVNAGLSAARARGVKLGAVNKFTPKHVAQIKALRAGGVSMKDISDKLSISIASVYRLVKL